MLLLYFTFLVFFFSFILAEPRGRACLEAPLPLPLLLLNACPLCKFGIIVTKYEIQMKKERRGVYHR